MGMATGADFESLRTQPFLFFSPPLFCACGSWCGHSASAPASMGSDPLKKLFSKLNWSKHFITAAER